VASLLHELIQVGCGAAGLQPVLQPAHGLGQACGDDGLEQVVHRAGFERRHSVAVVGGGEHRVAAAAGGACHVQAAQARHADVQEGHVGLVAVDGLHGARAVFTLGHDLQFGPGLGQHAAQFGTGQVFIVGQHGGGSFHAVGSGGRCRVATTPPSGPALSVSPARPW
jgi:hypothetical protein